MESRFRLFLLMPLLALALLSTSGCSLFRHKRTADNAEISKGPLVVDSVGSATSATITEPVLDPKVERRKIKTPKIRSHDWEIGGFGGILGIEDFGSNSVKGARLDFHVTESFFFEASYGLSRAHKTSAETLFGNLQVLSDSGRKYSYYSLSAGWDALQGEVFVGENRAYNSALYFVIGAGGTKFAGSDRFTWHGGFGYRVLVNNWVTVRMDVRDYLYDFDLLGPKKVVNNLEGTLGLSVFF